MNRKTKVLLGGALAASITVGLAMATPTIGAWYNVILSTGTAEQDIHTQAHLVIPGMDEDFSAVLVTEGASKLSMILPAAYTRRSVPSPQEGEVLFPPRAIICGFVI